MKQLAFDFSVVTAPTFDNFVAGCNAELLQRLQTMSCAPRDERFVYLWGAAASGKTHLLKSSIAALQKAGVRAAYFCCAREVPLDETLQGLDAVGLDEVDRLSESAQVGLFNLYNTLREKGGTLLAAGDVAPMRLGLRPDVVTRLGWGLVYEVHGLTDAEKTSALSARASARGFTLHAEVAKYLLNHVQRDMPALLAMLDALDRYSLESKRPVTVHLLRELLAAGQK